MDVGGVSAADLNAWKRKSQCGRWRRKKKKMAANNMGTVATT
jgi:hypothetical protein